MENRSISGRCPRRPASWGSGFCRWGREWVQAAQPESSMGAGLLPAPRQTASGCAHGSPGKEDGLDPLQVPICVGFVCAQLHFLLFAALSMLCESDLPGLHLRVPAPRVSSSGMGSPRTGRGRAPLRLTGEHLQHNGESPK